MQNFDICVRNYDISKKQFNGIFFIYFTSRDVYFITVKEFSGDNA